MFGSNWKTNIQKIAVPEVLPAYWNDDKMQVLLNAVHLYSRGRAAYTNTPVQFFCIDIIAKSASFSKT